MLVIYKRQLNVLSEKMFNDFKKSSEIHLRKKVNQWTLDITDENLRLLVNKGINKAFSYKIVERKDVLCFLEYMAALGCDFEGKPGNEWAKKILSIRNLSGKEKINRIKNKYLI